MGNDPFVNECLQQAGCGGTEISPPSGVVNVVIVLDASAGMADEIAGGTRMDMARAGLNQYVESLPPGINVGLLLYGHRGSGDESDKAESCAAIDLVYRVGPVDRVTLKAMINSAPSIGWAPVAESLLAAQRALAGREMQTNRILLVTSGGDSCGGDPCQIVKEMRQSGVTTTIDVIGLNLDYEAIEPLQCVANTTGGLYYSAPTADELAEAWEALQQREEYWFETESCLAPNRDLYLSCRQDELSQFTDWADSTGWTQDHHDQFVEITQALAEEQAELAVPSTPTPMPTATP
jgi:Ca-activated chloride channel family protein